MESAAELAADIAELAQKHGFRIGTAESVSAGLIGQGLVQGPDSSEWFAGGVIAFADETKQKLLGVAPGPVITATCAEQMACGACELLDVDAAVSSTGVGGPDTEEGHAAGTVFIATCVRGAIESHAVQLSGEPSEIVEATRMRALHYLLRALQQAARQ